MCYLASTPLVRLDLAISFQAGSLSVHAVQGNLWADLTLRPGATVEVAVTDADVLVDSNDTVPL